MKMSRPMDAWPTGMPAQGILVQRQLLDQAAPPHHSVGILCRHTQEAQLQSWHSRMYVWRHIASMMYAQQTPVGAADEGLTCLKAKLLKWADACDLLACKTHLLEEMVKVDVLSHGHACLHSQDITAIYAYLFMHGTYR